MNLDMDQKQPQSPQAQKNTPPSQPQPVAQTQSVPSQDSQAQTPQVQSPPIQTPSNPSQPQPKSAGGIFKNKKLILIGGLIIVLALIGVIILVILSSQNGGSGEVSVTPTVGPGSPVGHVSGKVAFMRDATVVVADMETLDEKDIGTVPVIESNENMEVKEMAWSDDGKLIGFSMRDSKTDESLLQVMTISDGTVLDVLSTTALDPIYDFAWIPGSLEVLISYAETIQSGNEQVQKFYLGKLSVLGFPGKKQFLDWVRPIVDMNISEVGFIYYLDDGNELWRVPLDGGKFLPLLRSVESFNLSLQGDRVVYERVVDGEIWISNEDGTNPKQITHSTAERLNVYGKGGRSNPIWSPSGRTILFSETGANYKGFGLVNEDTTGLRSVEENSISPKIIYKEVFTRRLDDLQWLNDEIVMFFGEAESSEVDTDDLFWMSILNEEYEELLQDVVRPIWSPL